MKLDQFAHLYSKPVGNHTLKIMKKIPGNLLKNLEKSWKYHGILSVQKSGNPGFSSLWDLHFICHLRMWINHPFALVVPSFISEMVSSLGDTAISLHVLQPPRGEGVRSDLDSENWSFQFSGGGVFWVRSDLDSGKQIRVFNWGGGVLRKVSFGIWKEN